MSQLKTLLRRVIRRGYAAADEAATPPLEEIGVREAYHHWAPTYAAETATSALDEQLANEMLTSLPRARLLDAGCGIGRRLREIPNAIGIDLSPAMLAAGQAQNVIAGDIREMPFASNHFDMVWCRLVIGHIPDAARAYQELSRVCAPGGHVFVTDFHPDAAAAGHQRTLTGSDGRVRAIEHYVHKNHAELALQAGLMPVSHRCGCVGTSIRSFYERGIGLRAYKRDLGLRLVEAFLFHKPVAAEPLA